MKVSEYQVRHTEVELVEPVTVLAEHDDDGICATVLIGLSEDDAEGEVLELVGTPTALLSLALQLADAVADLVGPTRSQEQ
jgi:hypothetical protein